MRRLLVAAALAIAAACAPQPEAPSGVPRGAPSPLPAGDALPALPDDPLATFASPLAGFGHLGSTNCMTCHPQQHADWAASAHAGSIREADLDDEDQLSAMIPCSDMTVTHVLGDRHQIRFLQERPEVPWGEGRYVALPCSWDVHAKSLEMLHENDWQSLPFETSCARCHVTDFRPSSSSWDEAGVGCEACHGPGAGHSVSPRRGTILGFRGSARDEVTVCASCHLQDGRSQRTGRKFPDGYVPGGSLLDDFRFDWSVLDNPDPAKAIDVHQKLNIRDVLRDGKTDLRCTSCHQLHGLTHDKHEALPPVPFCQTCHEPDMKVKEYRQSCNTCEF